MEYFGKYDTPADLLADKDLSTGEKIELLESWRDDKEAYMRAAGEGMQGPSRSDAPDAGTKHLGRAFEPLWQVPW